VAAGLLLCATVCPHALEEVPGLGTVFSDDGDEFEEAKDEVIEAVLPGRIAADGKIAGQMAKRGWSVEDVVETVQHPDMEVPVRDTRWNPATGGQNDEPATAYVRDDGSYVVVNDNTGDVIQVSDRNNPDWKAPWD
jgi:hypothetical protein